MTPNEKVLKLSSENEKLTRKLNTYIKLEIENEKKLSEAKEKNNV